MAKTLDPGDFVRMNVKLPKQRSPLLFDNLARLTEGDRVSRLIQLATIGLFAENANFISLNQNLPSTPTATSGDLSDTVPLKSFIDEFHIADEEAEELGEVFGGR